MPDIQKYKVISGDFIGATGTFVRNDEHGRTLKNVQMPHSANAPYGFKAKEFTFPQGTLFEQCNEGGKRRKRKTRRTKIKRVRSRRA
jgi:hypothetical protein